MATYVHSILFFGIFRERILSEKEDAAAFPVENISHGHAECADTSKKIVQFGFHVCHLTFYVQPAIAEYGS